MGCLCGSRSFRCQSLAHRRAHGGDCSCANTAAQDLYMNNVVRVMMKGCVCFSRSLWIVDLPEFLVVMCMGCSRAIVAVQRSIRMPTRSTTESTDKREEGSPVSRRGAKYRRDSDGQFKIRASRRVCHFLLLGPPVLCECCAVGSDVAHRQNRRRPDPWR